MEMYPNGFLSEIYCLTGLPQYLYEEMAVTDDFNDAEAGEILLTPELLSAICEENYDGCGAFLGADSMAGSTMAQVIRLEGPEALARYFDALKVHAKPSLRDAASLLPGILDLSQKLSKYHSRDIVKITSRDGISEMQTSFN